jgi:hypothetical protein
VNERSAAGRTPPGRIALVFRGDRRVAVPSLEGTRLAPVADALGAVGLSVEAAVYSDDAADEFRTQLLGVDAALVWVDPVSDGSDRTKLDAILREASAHGVWISAHPDTTLKMGTKEVLYRTRELGWGAETHLYRTVEELRERFPQRLASGGARVLKQYRGNGGIGVQKVELVGASSRPEDAVVRVQGARLRDEVTEDMPLSAFLQQCARYFAYADGEGRLIDQPFQRRITDGIIRCYLVKNEVVGFARQYPEETPSVGAPAAPRRVFGLPSAKTMYPPDEPALASLRAKVEAEWVPAMQTLLDIGDPALPALWDADFLLGPKNAALDDTYVLCEINVSAVLPFPPEAPAKLAQATVAAIGAAPR